VGSTRKLPSGNWEARYRDNAGRSRSKTFTTKKAAEQFLQLTAVQQRQGTWVDPALGQMTVGEWAARWMENRQDRPSTVAKNDSFLRNHVLPEFATVPLLRLTPLDVQGFVNRLNAKGLAPSSVRSVVNVLTGLLGAAVDAGLLYVSPARKLTLPKDDADERVFLSADQVNRVAGAVPARYRALILTAAYTGMRWGELAGLKRTRLNLLHKQIDVAEVLYDVRGHFSYGPPKTRAGRRTISLPDGLAYELSEHLRLYGSQGQEHVFTGAEGGLLARTTFRARVWVPAVAATGFDPAPTFHDLRHTHVALLIAAGVQVKAIQVRLGHASITTTLNTYGHLLPEVDEAVRSGLERLLAPRALA
jgi:integrase